MGTKVVASVISVLAFGANTEEITDWWVMTDLLAVDLGSIGIATLESLANDGV